MLNNLRAMAILVAVVDCGSFGKAANQFGISTSAVSQQIKALEQELGVTLLYRSTRTLNLTKTGILVYDAAKAMVNEAQKMYNTLETLQNKHAQTITLNAPSNAIYYHSTLALNPLLDKQKAVLVLGGDDFDRQANNRTNDNDITLYLSSEPLPIKTNVGDSNVSDGDIALISVPQMLLVSPTYTAINTIDDLQDATFIGQANAIDFADGQTITPTIGFEIKDSDLALMLACDGFGVVPSHYLDAYHWITTKQLIPLPFDLPKITLYANIKSSDDLHTQKPSPAQCLIALKNYFSQLTL